LPNRTNLKGPPTDRKKKEGRYTSAASTGKDPSEEGFTRLAREPQKKDVVLEAEHEKKNEVEKKRNHKEGVSFSCTQPHALEM